MDGGTIPLKYAPLFDKIFEHLQQGFTGFHMPGHQQGRACADEFKKLMAANFFKMDLTELPGLDNLKNPLGCIKESQGLAARLFGASKTFFLVNGSTVGLQAALLAINKNGHKVIVSRNSHISILNGLVISGGEVVLAPVEIDYKWGLPLGTPSTALTAVLKENPTTGAVVLTQPTYHGVGRDAFDLTREVREWNVPLIIDEAHGAHLYFQKKIPLSAQQSKADIVVHGAHKTLTALTQASLLHVNNPKWEGPIQQALDILQTTSPSYLLLSSLDVMQRQMHIEGNSLVAASLELAEELRSGIRMLSGYQLFGDELPAPWLHDPTKVVISAAELGLSGWELALILRDKHGIVVEMSDYYSVLCMLTFGHRQADVLRLLTALREIMQYEKKKPFSPREIPPGFYEGKSCLVFTPRQVFEKEKVEVDLRESVGRITGQPLTVYPPGVPLLWPGQVILPEHLEYLQWAQESALQVQGISPEGKISVLADT